MHALDNNTRRLENKNITIKNNAQGTRWACKWYDTVITILPFDYKLLILINEHDEYTYQG